MSLTDLISVSIDWVLILSVPLTLSAGAVAWLLPYGRRARCCFSGLLLLFALALVRIVLFHIGYAAERPTVFFWPLWYTLSFGVLLFYGVKMRLFPGYRMRLTDLKHFFLPLLQAVFFLGIFCFTDRSYQLGLLHNFIPTWYKPIEGTLFILLFFSYLAMAYRYLKFKQAVLRRHGREAEAQTYDRLRRSIKVLFFLGGVNTSYLLSDFFAWQFLGLNLYTVKGFASLNDLSFAAMSLWVGWFVWREYGAAKAVARTG